MLGVMKIGGLTTGGMNFDAKVRRESFEPVDLFYAHIGGMDAFARGLKIAAAIRKDGRLIGSTLIAFLSLNNKTQVRLTCAPRGHTCPCSLARPRTPMHHACHCAWSRACARAQWLALAPPAP